METPPSRTDDADKTVLEPVMSVLSAMSRGLFPFFRSWFSHFFPCQPSAFRLGFQIYETEGRPPFFEVTGGTSRQ